MGEIEFRLPDIGEGVVEGEIVTWHVNEGEVVKEDDPILDVMTDKATVTIPSPTDGKIMKIQGKAGEMLKVGQVCIVFEVEGAPSIEKTEEVKEEKIEVPEIKKEEKKTQTTTKLQPKVRKKGERVMASPAVRKKARESGIDLSSINGSGPGGRITHSDLDTWKDAGSPVAAAGPARTALSGIKEIPVIGLRRKIAEQMSKSYSTIAHFSYFEEVDVTNLEQLRVHLNDNRSENQPKLTYLPFIMQALVKALSEHPQCNAHYMDEDEKVLQFEAINLGIATQTDKGLFVPVVKNVEAQDIWESAKEMIRVSSAARDGKATMDDLQGSTFTITSLGRMGGLGATPIINHPEVGILGVHNAKETPVVIDGRIEIRRIMRLSSSWDHRVVDGWDGAMLVQTLKNLLEHPATIFM
ncbi:MAG: Lipoamide acyltransferase component of branched-chain alpha-keto acid dehydrogenase complex [Methanobacteriota archaeon]|nr:MAG: Lipoamide acyltransferase component of branched-chain alpha-keto acid dehydrogenase complex [Euryarchaeota archaeon]